MNSIFKLNAIIAIIYTAFFVGISFLFNKDTQSIILEIIYSIVAGFHFIAMGILMAIYHFQSSINKRNGYMASFVFIWLLLLMVHYWGFYISSHA